MSSDLNSWMTGVNLRVLMAAMSWQWVPGFEEVEHVGFFSVVDVRCGGLIASSAFHLSRSGSGFLFLCE